MSNLSNLCASRGSENILVLFQAEDKLVFTGDTLFLGGCGRFFEGSAEQMTEALVSILARLPPQTKVSGRQCQPVTGHLNNTKVYCGHEYSLQNLAYGNHVEPDNQVDELQI